MKERHKESNQDTQNQCSYPTIAYGFIEARRYSAYQETFLRHECGRDKKIDNTALSDSGHELSINFGNCSQS